MSKARVFLGSLALFPEAGALAVAAQAELISKGFADSRVDISSSWQCVMVKAEIAPREFIPAGMIAFMIEEPTGRLWVNLSFVVEQFRGRGVYRLMYEALRVVAKQKKCRTIEGATHVKNAAMRAVAKRVGRAEEFVVLVDNIDVEPEIITQE